MQIETTNAAYINGVIPSFSVGTEASAATSANARTDPSFRFPNNKRTAVNADAAVAAACGYAPSRAGVRVVTSTLVIAMAQLHKRASLHALCCTAIAMPNMPKASAKCSAAITELGLLYTAALVPVKKMA